MRIPETPQRDPINFGVYRAICSQVVDLGTQKNERYGGENQQVLLGFEIEKLMDDGRPYVISRTVTMSSGEGSSLKQLLDGMRGRPFTRDELKSFDLRTLLGKSCQLVVGPSETQKPKIVALAPLGSAAPLSMKNEPLYWSWEKIDQAVMDRMPSWMKQKIQLSREWQMVGQESEYPLPDVSEVQNDGWH